MNGIGKVIDAWVCSELLVKSRFAELAPPDESLQLCISAF